MNKKLLANTRVWYGTLGWVMGGLFATIESNWKYALLILYGAIYIGLGMFLEWRYKSE